MLCLGRVLEVTLMASYSEGTSDLTSSHQAMAQVRQ